MGLINNDVFVASNGVQKAGTYISFNNETLYLRKSSPAMMMPPSSLPSSSSSSSSSYLVNANYRVFWDKEAKDAGKTFIELRNVSTAIEESQLTGNLYAILYDELKKQYANSVDDWARVASDSSAPASSSDSSSAPASSTDSSAPASSTDSSAPASSTDSSAPASSTDSSAPASSTDSSAPADSSVTPQ